MTQTVTMTAVEIAELVGGKVVGDENRVVTRIGVYPGDTDDTLVFAFPQTLLGEQPPRGVVLIKDWCGPKWWGSTSIMVDDPRLAFAVAASVLAPPAPPVIDPWATVYPCVRVGQRVDIRPGAVVGAPGLGWARRPDGVLAPFPHVAGVVLEDDVSIGGCATIDRGSLTDTVIGRGTKIDNLVHVGHGAIIGEHSLVVAGAVLCGSVRVGSRCFIGAGALLREGVHVGDGATVGMGAVVLRDVEAGETVVGNPARVL